MLTIPNYQILRQIYDSNNSIVYQGLRTADNQPVILKVLKEDYPNPVELTRYRQEYNIIRHLSGVEGVINTYSIEKYQNGLMMCLEDFGGQSLKDWLTKRTFTLEELLDIAIQATDILDQIHQQNIIHKDINPTNFVWNPTTGILKIIDFGISTQLTKQYLTLKNPNVLEGTLIYISPEQTGRMNRTLDYRTDFYSLGVTFYELLTGKVPFKSDDAMELVHCHIAKMPEPICQVNPNIPPIISDIVIKLMAKNAEDRYQSAFGVKFDLKKCLKNLQSFEKFEGLNAKNLADLSFELAQQDFSTHFQIPQKLYGRELEIKTLLTAFEQVTQGKNRVEMMLVAGYSGIGKSVLVKEIYKSLSAKKGYFITGKFDQLQRNIPYSALVNAFGELVQQLLTESESQLSEWRTQLLTALNPNGQVITDVIPDIELMIGPQPPVPQLGPTESQNRFNLVFQNFLRVFCQPEHPLVIFLDDLQWIDSATLKLLEVIMMDDEKRSFFFIGAFRNNEVDVNHPFMMTLETLRQANVPISQITLQTLNFDHINQLIADTLHDNLDTTQSLTKLVMQKTEGNPFFVNQFLHALYEQELLKFVPPKWQWDIAQIEALNITDNVVELMVEKLQKLPISSQTILRLAACIGNHFKLDILSVISENSTTDTFQALMPVLTEGLILPISELEITSDDIIRAEFNDDPASQLTIHHFRFLHDRVQQAAYALIEQKQKQTIHLKIGRLLLQNTLTVELDNELFDIVGHFNRGIEQMDNQLEKNEIAQLNLRAGQKAKAAIAYEPAINYFNMGLAYLGADSWETQYDLTVKLHLSAVEVQYLNNHFEQATTLVETVLQKAATSFDRVTVYEKQILYFDTQNKQKEAIETGLQALQMLNIALSKSPPQNIDFEGCYNLPEMLEPKKQLALRILVSMMSPAYVVSPMLFPSLVYTMVNLSLQYGNAPQSAFAYTLYGMLLCGKREDIENGYRAGKLALKLLDKFNTETLKPIVQENFDSCVRPWKEHFSYSTQSYQKSIQQGLELGDVKIACHNAMHYSVSTFLLGKNLDEVHQIFVKYLAMMLKNKQEWNLVYTQVWSQIALNLQDKSDNTYALVGDFFDERKSIPQFIKDNNGVSLLCVYLGKEQLAYLFKNRELALENAKQADKYKENVSGMILYAIHNFYDSLIHLALYSNADEATRTEYLQKVAENQKQMKTWAYHAPMNYQHKYDLVEAEKARVLGQLDAIDWYERAIKGARDNDYIQEEALAYELAAEFYLVRGMDKFAQTYLKEAHYRYQLWGSFAKVKDLEQRYPQILMIPKTASIISTNATISVTQIAATSTKSVSGWLDLNSVTKAAQTLSGEIVLSRLLEKMMHIVIENAGAEQGFLLLPQQEQWFIEAEGRIDQEDIQVLQSIPIETKAIAQTIIQYVIRTMENVVLNNATQESHFTRDAYIIKQRPKSILCAPLIHQCNLMGILYLENNLTEGAFTPARLEVLKVLSSQIAISIENALLYRTLEQKVEERTAQLAEANEEITALNEQLKSENLRMGAELDVSRQLQQMLLPKDKELEAIENLDIAGFMEPADEVGGDYYDVLYQDGRVLIGIGDVTGHGLESGALAIMVQSGIRTLLACYHELDSVTFLSALNQMVYHNVIRMNVEKSLTLALLSYQNGQLVLTGQHEEMIVVKNGELELIDTMDLGFPIGLDGEITEFVNQVTMPLNAGDVVVLYTDGITEAVNSEKEEYRLERLCQVIQQNWQKTVQEIREAVINDVRQFIGEQKVFDDITLLVLKQK